MDSESTLCLSSTFMEKGSLISSSMENAIPKLYQEQVQPIDMSFNLVRPLNKSISIGDVARKLSPERKKNPNEDIDVVATVVKVFRSTGCPLCREQGQVISKLVSAMPDVSAWGIICEIENDDDELLELRNDYFRHPFYLDKKMNMYKALGGEKLSPSWNPLRLVSMYKNIAKRLKDKSIPIKPTRKEQNSTLGGVVVFDSEGEVRFARKENPLDPPDIDSIQDTINRIRMEHKEQTQLMRTLRHSDRERSLRRTAPSAA